jgi:3-hydroxybutyryl-CoA dehydrogenase
MDQEIHTIAVIAVGSRGRIVARAALHAGYRVILQDASNRTLEHAACSIRGGLTETTWTANLNAVCSVEDAVREADLIIEAAVEEMEVKIELFTIFDKFAKANAILASTSRAVSVEELAAVTFCPDRCVGMQFSAEINVDPAITLVRAPQTSDETFALAGDVAMRLQKCLAPDDLFPGDVREIVPLKSAAAR